MKLKNIRFRNASERAYRIIKEMIAQYQLIPGQKITYIQLAEKLEMSKTPIINALYRLEQDEFVISIPNRGFFVNEIDIEEVAELFKIREGLEILAAEEAMKNQNPETLKEIEKAMIAHRKYHYDIVTRKRLALDAAFHLKIAEMGRNRNLVRFLRQVFEHIYLRHRSEGIPRKRLVTSVEEHQKIFDAIREKNMAKARRLMKQHVRAGKIATIKGIQKAVGSFEF